MCVQRNNAMSSGIYIFVTHEYIGLVLLNYNSKSPTNRQTYLASYLLYKFL